MDTTNRYRNTALMLFVGLLAACSGGGGGGGATNSSGNASLAGGIRATVDPSRAAVPHVLAIGDRYEVETDPQLQLDMIRDIWEKLTKPVRWVSPTNALYTYQFYEDPSFQQGPLYRYTGFATDAGSVVIRTVGNYWASDGRGPFLAVCLYTWHSNPEFLVFASDTLFSHGIEHTNGMPIEQGFGAVSR